MIIKLLDDHIEALPNGTMGELLRGCKRLIEAQAEDLAEKRGLIEILKCSEDLKIAQLNRLQIDLDNAKVVRKRRAANLKKGSK